ncbi:MAG: hypothetical protein EHM20_11560 [Alphaproteobacteria bacterium]|nr:MAG: hypothetical protein EHM20_11560 [Alphaproteobacteria bacterium]
MKWLRKIGKDLSEGRNLEIYLTILISVVISVLSILNVVNTEIVATITLATLSLLALSTISNREQISSFQKQVAILSTSVDEKVLENIRASSFFLTEQPHFENKLEKAQKIYIAGATLTRTVTNYLGIFEQRLKEGAVIRLIIIDPQSDAVKQAALRSYGVQSDDFYRDRVKPTIDLLNILASLPELKGKLELRFVPFMPSFGLKLVDPDSTDGNIFVEIYQHKSLEPNPAFMLDVNRDEKWYRFFQNQFEVLWSSSRPATPSDGYLRER